MAYDPIHSDSPATSSTSIEESFGEPIHVYTRQQAVQDGVLVPVGEAHLGEERISVCFTSALLEEHPDVEECKTLIRQGFALLNTPDSEDDGYRKLRVVVADKVWVIHDGDGVTFLRPQDY